MRFGGSRLRVWEGSLRVPAASLLKSSLGGSWVVISGVISPLIWNITRVTRLITPLIATHEPPSKAV